MDLFRVKPEFRESGMLHMYNICERHVYFSVQRETQLLYKAVAVYYLLIKSVPLKIKKMPTIVLAHTRTRSLMIGV